MKKKYYIYWHPRGQKRGSFNQNRSIVETEPKNKDTTIKKWKKEHPNRVFENIEYLVENNIIIFKNMFLKR